MEPTEAQFEKKLQTIYRKGEDQSGLETRATQQRTERETERRDIGDTAQGVRDYQSGITNARNAVDMGITVQDAIDSPKLYGGPVSGTELAKAKQRKIEKRRTSAREMKRR